MAVEKTLKSSWTIIRIHCNYIWLEKSEYNNWYVRHTDEKFDSRLCIVKKKSKPKSGQTQKNDASCSQVFIDVSNILEDSGHLYDY